MLFKRNFDNPGSPNNDVILEFVLRGLRLEGVSLLSFVLNKVGSKATRSQLKRRRADGFGIELATSKLV